MSKTSPAQLASCNVAASMHVAKTLTNHRSLCDVDARALALLSLFLGSGVPGVELRSVQLSTSHVSVSSEQLVLTLTVSAHALALKRKLCFSTRARAPRPVTSQTLLQNIVGEMEVKLRWPGKVSVTTCTGCPG